MTYSPTVISAVVGEKSGGKPAPNRPDDVKKIQSLLQRVLGPRVPSLTDGICDDSMKTAIGDFQRLWGGMADSTVGPNGQTLRRLDRLANPLALKPIKLGYVAYGGYAVAFLTCDGGPLPARESGYTRHLCFPDEWNSIDVTDRPQGDLIGKQNVGGVLEIIDNVKGWATVVKCRIQLRYHGTVISTSESENLKTPVQPHNGRMLPLDETNNGPKLLYEGNIETKDFHGRMFAQVLGYEKFVFIWNGQFETESANRGFDCITYAGTTCGASIHHMKESPDLCASLSTTPVEHSHKAKDPKTGKETLKKITLDNADVADLKDFFATGPTDYFLMYSGGHIVVVGNGNVYEFNVPSGYYCTPAATWLSRQKKKFTLRKLSGKPARAT